MAKDVVTFLNWAAEPEHDERKKIGLQSCALPLHFSTSNIQGIILSALLALSVVIKRKVRTAHSPLPILSLFAAPTIAPPFVKASLTTRRPGPELKRESPWRGLSILS